MPKGRYTMHKHLITQLSAILFCILALAASALAAQNGAEIQGAIVKIFTVKSNPTYYAPWSLDAPEQVTGSGTVISGSRIITNAHVVSNAQHIEFKFNQSPEKHAARVSFVSHELDLALLVPEEPGVLEKIQPLSIGEVPGLMEEVFVYGYPTGGDMLSITKGVLSRMEFQTYSHGFNSFLAGQIDAAINPGNSGGPVISSGKLIGVIMQKSRAGNVENTGYMIPTPMLNHFLEDIADKTLDGVPTVGIGFQQMDSPTLRERYRMQKGQSGVLVTAVQWDAPVKGVVMKDDVLLSVDGSRIANDGTTTFRSDERVSFAYHINKHQMGQDVEFTLLRDGREQRVSVALKPYSRSFGMVPRMEFDREPSFFIFGGMILLRVNMNYLCTWKDCDAPDRFSILYRRAPEDARREYVSILRVLPSEVNRGYHDIYNFIVEKINGQDYRDFHDFHHILINTKDKYVVMTNDTGQQVVIDRAEAERTHAAILTRYKISKDKSEDLRD